MNLLSNSIKEATKGGHQDTEKKVVMRIKHIKTEQDYLELLRCFYAYFSAVERAIAPYITANTLPDHQERRNSAYIKADIQELGGDLSNLPAATAPSVTNELQAMGALYVLEGSIMGGPYIVQMLKRLGITRGFSFFSGYGENSGQMWHSFTESLNSLPKSELDKVVAVDTAVETFRRFGDVFDEKSLAEQPSASHN